MLVLQLKLKLIDPNHESLQSDRLLISAGCCAYAYKDFHDEFMDDTPCLIGCPKLDNDYYNIISDLITINNFKEIVVTRMEVFCCTKLSETVELAIQNCEKEITLKNNILSIK